MAAVTRSRVNLHRHLPSLAICITAALVLLSVDLATWPVPRREFIGNTLVSLARSSDQDARRAAGVSGQRFSMEFRRELSSATNFASLNSAMATVGRHIPVAPLQRPDSDQTYPYCDTWAVITTINPPSRTIRQLLNVSNLCVCVVADKKSPPASEYDVRHLRGDGFVYLTPELQRALPYSIVEHLPWNHFGRKNLGFLFAMHHGARIIYDTDDDNELLADVNAYEAPFPLPVTFRQTDRFFSRRHLVPDEGKQAETTGKGKQPLRALNPYPAFGAPHAWPRGLPLDEVRPSTSAVTCSSGSNATSTGIDLIEEGLAMDVGVIQSLANHDPDVDAIYRLGSLPLPFSFRSDLNNGLPVAVAYEGSEEQRFSPYNAQATLHFHSAFYTMLLPVSVHGRVSDIWRGYFAQRLFWETGHVLAFAAPWVEQVRNPHDYLGDFEAESDLYSRTGALLDHLAHDWQCSSDPTAGVDRCLLELYEEMYRTGIVEAADLRLVTAWLADLRAIGYEFPQRLGQNRSSSPAVALSSSKGLDTNQDVHIIDVADFTPANETTQPKGVAGLTFPWKPASTIAADLPQGLACKRAWASIYLDAELTRPFGVESANLTWDGETIAADIAITHCSETDDAKYIVLSCLVDEGAPPMATDSSKQRLLRFRLQQPMAFLPTFEDVGLIMHFNHAAQYHLVPDLEAMYGRAFPNHVFIGTNDPDASLDPEIARLIHVNRTAGNGWRMPYALQVGMDLLPDVKGGHLLTNNDVAMRFWKWHRRDWTRVAGAGFDCAMNLNLSHNDSAWDRFPFPYERDESTVSNLLAQYTETEQAHLWDICGDHTLYFMYADAFYVPSRLRQKYLGLLRGAEFEKAFEALTPMLLSMTQPPLEWDYFNSMYWVLPSDREVGPERFLQAPESSILHPYKFGMTETEAPFEVLPERKVWYRMPLVSS